MLFKWMDETARAVENHTDEPYLDSLVIVLDALFHQAPPPHLDADLSRHIETKLQRMDLSNYATDDIRKAIQLAILKGMKNATQQQHLPTPDTVAMIIGYIAAKLTQHYDNVRLFDPVAGTANLLTITLDYLGESTAAYASEIDPTLLNLAACHANLQKKEIEFFHQDSLRPSLLDPVHLVVADLPVGYYPDDTRAAAFELKADEGHSYAHHLLIEQSMYYTTDGGYLIFLIPDFLFESDQSDKLRAFIREHAHIIGLISLPDHAFKNKKHRKSIFILQKKGKYTTAPKQPLLVKWPSFKHKAAQEDILGQVNTWFAAYFDNQRR